MPSSFTKTGGDPTTIDVPLAFDFPWKGGGDPSPEIAGEWNLSEPVGELLKGAGIIEQTQSIGSTTYIPGPITTPLTIKVWRSSSDAGPPDDALFWVFQDCKVQLEWTFTPGESTSCTATIQVGAQVAGAVAQPGDFPSADFGTQLTLANTILRGAQAQIGSVGRGFLDGTITLDAGFEDAPDSNSLKGTISEQADRTFTWSGGFYVDDSDPDQDYANLITEGPSSDHLLFNTGDTPGDASNPAAATSFLLHNLNYTSVSYRREAGRVIWDLEAYATALAGAPDSEVVISGI